MERKLAAIVSADVEGFSRIVGLDEAGTLARLREIHRKAIDPPLARYGGRVVKTMGDGLLLDFGSAVNAVACVVEIQRSVAVAGADVGADRRIAIRFGIHIGDIVIDGEDILGDGVNIAARLQALAESGGVCVSGAVMDEVRARLPYRFIDEGEQMLKNITRPVHAFRLVIEDAVPAPPASAAFAARPVVAVLPFDNMSGDPAEDYFVEGLTEEIITTLSYWRWFPAIARNSTFVYKGRPKNVGQIGRELGVAYLLEGSARRGGNRVRVTAQLVETATGHHLWAERFDRDIADIFAVQEEIAQRVVVSVEPEVNRAERQRALRTRPENLSAWDLALKALSLQERMSRAGHRQARETLDHALKLDPGLGLAWSLLSLCHYHEGILGWAENRTSALLASRDAAQHAIELDELDWLGQALYGMGHLWIKRDHAAALESQERAVSLNPSAPLGRHFLACIHEFSGRPAEALPHIDAVLRLDPRYRFGPLAIADKALCYFLMGDFVASYACAEKAVRLQPVNVRAHQRLVAALSALGRNDEAIVTAAELRRLQPDLSLDYVETTYPFQFSVERDRFIAALRAAGLLDS
jgi:adenylate cyclase